MKFKLEALTGKLILTRGPGITWPTIPFRATAAPKSTATWQLAILWICGLIGQCLAHQAASNRAPLRHKIIFLAIVASIVIPVLIEKLRF
jgi:predicted membrane channel-forming protein YqfA (hemolysin III family)